MSIEEAILEKVRALPPEKKTEVLEYVSGLEVAEHPPFRSPKGILADRNFTLTEEDLAEARREVAKALSRNNLSIWQPLAGARGSEIPIQSRDREGVLENAIS